MQNLLTVRYGHRLSSDGRQRGGQRHKLDP